MLSTWTSSALDSAVSDFMSVDSVANVAFATATLGVEMAVDMRTLAALTSSETSLGRMPSRFDARFHLNANGANVSTEPLVITVNVMTLIGADGGGGDAGGTPGGVDGGVDGGVGGDSGGVAGGSKGGVVGGRGGTPGGEGSAGAMAVAQKRPPSSSARTLAKLLL
jgi:hypothetical protein